MLFRLFLCCFFLFIGGQNSFAQVEYLPATIQSIEKNREETIYTITDIKTHQSLIISEPKEVFRSQIFEKGDSVFYSISSPEESETNQPVYLLHEHVRGWALFWWFVAFVGCTFFITRGKSFGAFIGLIFSMAVLLAGVIPALKNGKDPFWVCLFAAMIISLVSMYASHGWRRATSISLISVWTTLLLCSLIGFFTIRTVHLFGFGEESASVLVMNGYQFDFAGLLLGGFLLGCIGILDDVVSTQTEATEQIIASDPSLASHELFARVMSIGHEHIFSMINTLMLVYFSASLPMFLLMFSGDSELSMILNSEMIAEEVVRTLVGSFGIVLAVPISTFFAVKYIGRKV